MRSLLSLLLPLSTDTASTLVSMSGSEITVPVLNFSTAYRSLDFRISIRSVKAFVHNSVMLVRRASLSEREAPVLRMGSRSDNMDDAARALVVP